MSKPPATVVAKTVVPNRFDVARETGAQRDALMLCINLLIGDAQKLVRAGSLLNAIVPIDALGQDGNRKEAAKHLRAVRIDIDEILGELERP